jgi:mannan endo-1,4-beta-mannosidase
VTPPLSVRTSGEWRDGRRQTGARDVDAYHQSATSPLPHEEVGVTESTPQETRRHSQPRTARRLTKVYIAAIVCAVLAIGTGAAVAIKPSPPEFPISAKQYLRYLGVFAQGAPHSYAGVDHFAQAIGRQPNLVSYYSEWGEEFNADFAAMAANNGAVILVQIDPSNVSLESIANGQYDAYLRSYALAVKTFGAPVIMSFGHEMNGRWSPWGYQHVAPAVFVAAWRHIVNIFRVVGASNVKWMWTVNIVDTSSGVPIPDPSPWWPGRSYVSWVGIDGYFYDSSSTFAQVFGPTILDVRQLTGDQILIAETGAVPAADQPATINDLFAGARAYGLLGFLWYDQDGQGRDWVINSPTAFAALTRGATKFIRPPLRPVATDRSEDGSTSP